MNPAAILAAVEGALAVLEAVRPELERMAKGGQIDVETQAALRARLETLRLPDAWTGPEWQQSQRRD